MDIAAMETGKPEYRAIFDGLGAAIENLSSVIDSDGDLQVDFEEEGVVKGKSTAYHFDLTEQEIANIKNFGWSNP